MGNDNQQQTPPTNENENALTNDTHDIPDAQALALFDAQANQRIRKVWHDGRWWYSIIDAIALLTDSPRPRKYWADMKQRIQDEGFRELSAKCGQLKMRSPADGKYYTTDAADRETMFRIVQSVPSPRAEPFKQWLARTAEERLQEEEQPSKAIDRLSTMYAKKGYTDQWISQRVKKILVRDAITLEWAERGARKSRQIAQLTTELHEGTFDITPAQHLAVKDLPVGRNLQDSMTGLELAVSSLAEETAIVMHQTRDSQGMNELRRDVHEAGEVGKIARLEVEARIGQPVVSPVNYKQLRQERQRQLQAPLFDEIADGGADDE
jgi:hypothetical protein